MRRDARKDDNQSEIVGELRVLGCSVAVTHRLGEGFPDIVVGIAGRNWMFEIKTEGGGRLTLDEAEFQDLWRGQYDVIYCTEDALEIMGRGDGGWGTGDGEEAR
uniref:VRR-NUC domain-containing protein n=1 Tax=viral metagenome TaxID=1070528 RepID=A0A6M3KRR0_9ZZZZ